VWKIASYAKHQRIECFDGDVCGLHALGARSDQEFLDGRGDRHALDARPIESLRERIGRIDGFADQSHYALIAAAESDDDETKAARRYF